jgi:hypothetical protein
MTPSLKPVLLPKPEEKPYHHVLPAVERRAYRAAWRILHSLQADTEEFNGFGCPSRRRVAMVDRIAELVIDEMTGLKAR